MAKSPEQRTPGGHGQSEAEGTHQALLRAAYDADTGKAIAALEDGADVNATDPVTGLSALHIAVGTNNLPLTRILVEDWEATFKPDGKGRWPTVIAAECRVDQTLSDYVVEAESASQQQE